MKDQIIFLAIPVFFLCIGVEILVARRHGHGYRINDALTSLNLGTILECDQNGIKYEAAWWLLAALGAGFRGSIAAIAAISCGAGSILSLALMRSADAETAKAP